MTTDRLETVRKQRLAPGCRLSVIGYRLSVIAWRLALGAYGSQADLCRRESNSENRKPSSRCDRPLTRQPRRALLLLLVLAALGAFPHRSPAQAILSGVLLPTSYRCRNSGLIHTEIRLNWRGLGLLRGHLEFLILDGNRELLQFRHTETALTTGSQTFHICLPSAPQAHSDSVDVDVRFVTSRQTFELGTFPVRIVRSHERLLVMAVCEAPDSQVGETSGLMHGLTLEELGPGKDRYPWLRELRTVASRFAPERMPASALEYCAYDLVVIAPEALPSLRKRQLLALRDWTRAGGSLCIFTDGRLKAHHADLLNDLAETGLPPFSLGFGGRLDCDAAFADSGIGLFNSGLGRTAVVGPAIDVGAEARADAWRLTVAFLWKLRRCQVESLQEFGVWRIDQQALFPLHQALQHHYQHYVTGARRRGRQQAAPTPLRTLRVIPAASAVQFLQVLLPTSITIMPVSIMILILVGFVVCIGPLDYAVLGLLRCRKFTWILFPVVSVAFTAVTILLSRHYMGTADHRNALTVVDVDAAGKPLRSNRYELVFAARARDAVTHVAKALMVPMDDLGIRSYVGGRSSPRARGVISYSGHIPAQYSVSQSIGQWSPQMNRTLAIASTEAEPDFRLNWAAVDVDKMRDTQERKHLATAFLGSARGHFAVFLYHAGNLHTLNQPGDVVHHGGQHGQYIHQFLAETSARPSLGFFSIVSQLSPGARPNFEDITLLDSTDPEQYLLVAVCRDGNSYTIYRRLCPGSPPEPLLGPAAGAAQFNGRVE